ncbi:hypothetical protein GGI35DRAFT_436461 [Trichoderma velutinum]
MRPVKFFVSFPSLLFLGVFKEATTASENATLGVGEGNQRPSEASPKGRPKSRLSHERPPLREIRSSIIFYFLFFIFLSRGGPGGGPRTWGQSGWYPCSGNDAVSKVSRWV